MLNFLKGAIPPSSPIKRINGEVVLVRKNVLDYNDFNPSTVQPDLDLLGQRVSLQLVSSDQVADQASSRGKTGKVAYLEERGTPITPLKQGESAFKITFDWDEQIGIPGAFLIRNGDNDEFYLKYLTLEDVPGLKRVHFVCNSWVYPSKNYKKDRVFFSNKTYLPHETPKGLHKFREEELAILRGDGKGQREEWDRIYDYAVYNDLCDSKDPRPVLGGSSNYPYPRRGRTGRPPNTSDPKFESRLSLLSNQDIYVPRDERFGHLKMSDFRSYTVRSILQGVTTVLLGVDSTPNEFDKFQDVFDLYREQTPVSGKSSLPTFGSGASAELIKELFRPGGQIPFKFPTPQVIKVDKDAWRTDAEFCREMVAGVNPVIITCLEEFPPKSKLHPRQFGNQDSKIREKHIEKNLDGMTVSEAMEKKRLFILDYNDALMPYLRRINATSTKTYASRTLLFLNDDDTLKPLAIELSLPHPNGDGLGAVSKVYTPTENGVEKSIWELAKAYVVVNDAGYHQLISHWLHTHAAVEPFIIASNRQLSAVHPIYKLLHPHFRDTMNINALARQALINANGIVELGLFPSKYAMEMSSVVYKTWNFNENALPEELKKRGMAVADPESKHGVRLRIKDYPYATDGLEIWSAIKEWVEEYCSVYYKTDEMVQNDTELQSWWKEIREVGHGDLKDKPWWPKIQTRQELMSSCTIIIWMASALHASVNFGQYPFGGFSPNRPNMSRRFMPEKGSPEYEELMKNFEKGYLKTIGSEFQSLLVIAVIEILSTHSSDEIYLGQRDAAEWTTEAEAMQAFEKFGKKLKAIEEMIIQKNEDKSLKNRRGPVSLPYTLLVPSSPGGISFRGIPNSTSI